MTEHAPGSGLAANPQARRSFLARTLPLQMLLALVIGGLVGLVFPHFGAKLLPVSQAFVSALKMTIVPLVFSSISLGIYNMGRDLAALRRIVAIVLVWFFVATGVCSFVGLMMNALLHPGLGAHLSITGAAPNTAGFHIDLTDFLLGLIPTNIVDAMARQKVLQVLLFGILFGAALSTTGDFGQGVARFLRGVQLAIIRMVHWIIALGPLAILAAMAWLFATQGGGTLVALGKLIGALYLGLAVVVVLMCGVIAVSGRNPLSVIGQISEPLLLAFTTRSSESTMPVLMERLEAMGVPNRIVSTVIPLGYAFNQDGTSLYVTLTVTFAVEANGVPLTLAAVMTILLTGLIATKGMGNVSGGGLIAATTVLVALGLPVESVAILTAVDVFLDMGRTTVNVFGNTCAVLLVDRFSGAGGKVADEFATGSELPPH